MLHECYYGAIFAISLRKKSGRFCVDSADKRYYTIEMLPERGGVTPAQFAPPISPAGGPIRNRWLIPGQRVRKQQIRANSARSRRMIRAYPRKIYIMSRFDIVSCLTFHGTKGILALFPGRKRGLFKPKNNGPRQTGTQRTLTT